MLCCAGLVGGLVVGQALGGPWTYIAPTAGFGIGLIADMKLMKGHHHAGGGHDTRVQANKDAETVRGADPDETRTKHHAEHLGKT